MAGPADSVASDNASGNTAPHAAASLSDLLTAWLPSQRWFPLRGSFELQRVGGVRLAEPTEDVQLQVHVVSAAQGGERVSLSVPLTIRREQLDDGAAALIGRWDTEEGHRWVYDGTQDPEFMAAWLEMMRRESTTAEHRSEGHAYAGFEDWPAFHADTLRARLLQGEQSNTSVVIDAEPGPLILKFFRVLATGTNPDVEIGLALSAAGSNEVPLTYGSVTIGWRSMAAADHDDEEGQDDWVWGEACVLREFITGSRDAWRVATDAAGAGEDFTAEAAEIGEATGRLHLALAQTLGTRAVPVGTGRVPEVLADLAGRIYWGWRQAATTVGEELADRIQRVVESLRSAQVAAELPPLQRIHADYHLGQVLASPGEDSTRWTVLDFEGEPLREAAERSGWDLPLRDVVGMLRSFDYAGALAGSSEWTVGTQQAFLEGYGRTVGAPVDTASTVFTALLLDKALYETVYELKHRPEWVEVPASAVRRALDRETTAAARSAEDIAPGTVETVTERESQEDTMHAEQPENTGQAPSAGTETRNTDANGTGTTGDDAGTTGTAAGRLAATSTAGAGTDAGTLAASGATGEPASGTAAAGTAPLEVPAEVLDAVAHGRYHQPHEVLGAHLDDLDTVTFRVLRPMAEDVSVRTDEGTEIALRHENEGIWVGTAAATRAGHVPGYRILVSFPGMDALEQDDPYRYLPTVGELDQHLFREGRHETLWTALGSRMRHYSSPQGDVTGASFAVWAPNAQAVRVKGDFNGWDGRLHAMRSMGDSGIWEIFIPGIAPGAVYKYDILGQDGHWRDKADPMARWAEVPPATGSRVADSRYVFGDQEWMARRAVADPHEGPMSIYEVHAGSWRPGLSYREMADQLVEYVSWQGFTHVEFMPLAEHPFGGSWGYQVTGYYAPTSRFGTPDDFKYLVDRLHQAGIGVLLDWVPAHFPKDEWALAKFDGSPLYEYADPRKGEHPDWGTLVFDYGRTEVRNFLVANALYWLEEFHIDGLRVDAVASMLYLDYSRQDGEWIPNVHGGNHNLEAISFLQEATATAYKRNPGTVMVAEESTAFSGVTAPTDQDGLGFGLKWNMGWMHDSLQYMSEDPVNRRWHHNEMTFSLVYAWSENFVLPLSHDEVVHGKGSLLRKMPGDRWQQLASLRAYYGYMWAHPGKQLIFMGSEFGQESEWKESHGLDWWLTDNPQHKGLMKAVRDLNMVYREAPELWSQDNDPSGFQWIDQNDGDRNLFSFIRWSVPGQNGEQPTPLVCVANFAGSPHHDVRLGLPLAGEWEEVLNTDAETYGGSGVGNGGRIHAQGGPWHGQPASALITVPPLATVYLRPVG